MPGQKPDPLHSVEHAETESEKQLTDKEAAYKAAEQRRRDNETKSIQGICYEHFMQAGSAHIDPEVDPETGIRGHEGFDPTNNPQDDAEGLRFRGVGTTTGQLTDDTYKSKYLSPLTKQHRQIIVNQPNVTTLPVPKSKAEFKEAMWEMFSFMKKYGQDVVFIDFPSEKDVTETKLMLIAQAAKEVGVYPVFKDAKTQSKIDAFLASSKTNEPVTLLPAIKPFKPRWPLSLIPFPAFLPPLPKAIQDFTIPLNKIPIYGNAVVREKELVDWKGKEDPTKIAARKERVDKEYAQAEKVWEKTKLRDIKAMEDVYYTRYRNALNSYTKTTGDIVDGKTDAQTLMENRIKGTPPNNDRDAQFKALVEQGKQLEIELATIEDARSLARNNVEFYNDRLSKNSVKVATELTKMTETNENEHKANVTGKLFAALNDKPKDLERKRNEFETHLTRLKNDITTAKTAEENKQNPDVSVIDKLETQLDKIAKLEKRQTEMKVDIETFGKALSDVRVAYNSAYEKAEAVMAQATPAPRPPGG